MTYEQQLRAAQQEVDAALETWFARVFPARASSAVARAAAYSLLGGGKRVRGVLALETCRQLCGDSRPAASYAAAVEMLHCYSLIHDDLPCMDNDDTRRGQPSCHKAFDEVTALLAGDALLTAAFDALCSNDNTAQQNVSAVQLLARAAGPCGMVYGQELDLAAEACPVDEAGLLRIHEHKTGRLIRAAVALGATAGGAAPAQYAALDSYAADLGLVFQIVDDVLDVTSTQEVLGKPIGSDSENHKTTFVTLHGVDGALARAQQVTQRACDTLQTAFGQQAEFLCLLAQRLPHRSK